MVARIDGSVFMNEGKRPSITRERERLRALVARYGTVKAIEEYFRCSGEYTGGLGYVVGSFDPECEDSIGFCRNAGPCDYDWSNLGEGRPVIRCAGY